ncbi:MAG: hypothetical protein ACRD0W_09630 [Acidimicrobiales bacterium]
MGDLRLFAVPDVEPEPVEQMSYDQRLTLRNRDTLARGFHPATRRRLLDPGWGYRFKDCSHCYGSGHNLRTYWKCARNPRGHTGGPGTDIRIGWPACELLRIDGATP